MRDRIRRLCRENGYDCSVSDKKTLIQSAGTDAVLPKLNCRYKRQNYVSSAGRLDSSEPSESEGEERSTAAPLCSKEAAEVVCASH